MRYQNVVSMRRIAFAVLFLSILGLPVTLHAQPVQVQLGEYGGTATLVKTESGRYTWNGRPVFDGSTIASEDGSRYVLSRSGETWSAGYLPRLVRVELGESGSAITLRELENGQFWWNGLVESGLTLTAADGNVYRLNYMDGMWNAVVVTDQVTVPLGRSGEVVVLSRTDTGSFSYQGRVVREGLRLTDSAGRVYEFVLRGGSWTADPVSDPTAPPIDPGPDPAPAVRSDFRDAHVGELPLLRTGEDGTRRSVLKVGGAEYSVHELFSEGGVTRAPTFVEEAAETIEFILGQVDLLEAAYDDDRSGFRKAMETRWERAEESLEALFGREESRDILGSLPLGRNRAVDTREVVETLEDVLSALTDFDAFYDAVDDGVFEGAIDLDSADDVFDAVRSVGRLVFGSTPNTRFGAYLHYKRDGEGRWDDDLVLMDDEEGFGAFAYSPLEASRRIDLPNRGEADYVGRTVAVSPDDDLDTYTGKIEVNVRFASDRVSALVSELRDDSGRPWRYASADAESINLPSASLDDDDASFEVNAGNATVNYRTVVGAPRPRSLRADFDGTFVGEGFEAGDSVIGTWSLFTSTRQKPLLTAAFGADFDSTPALVRPVVDDFGEESVTYIGAQPNSSGRIRLGGRDEDGDYLEFAASDLFADGYGESVGPSLVSVARDRIEQQIQLLDLWLDVSSTDSERNSRRRDVWDNANDILFEIVFGEKFGARNPLESSYPRDRRGNPDDDEARSLLSEAVRALSSVSRFEDALEKFGVFYEERDVVEDVDLMFEVRNHDVRVEFRSTDYGRFGVWSRTVGTSAIEGIEYDRDDPSGAFAYSPLEQATYFVGDPRYPSNGTAYYEGSTLALDDSSDGPRTFEGEIALTVEWGSTINGSTVTSVIEDLRTVDRDTVFRYDGRAVDQIIFSTGLRLSRDDEVEFDSSRPSVRIRYFDAARSDTHWSGASAHSGKFVGTSRDGPLGVIGTWELGRSSGSVSLKGAYAADLVP